MGGQSGTSGSVSFLLLESLIRDSNLNNSSDINILVQKRRPSASPAAKSNGSRGRGSKRSEGKGDCGGGGAEGIQVRVR